MGDSTTLSDVPLTVNVVATYINGHIGVSTPAQLEARFPHAKYGHVWIDVTGANANTADVLDVETGDATPAIANLWLQSWRVLKRTTFPVIYCNRSNQAAVVAACASGGSILGKHYGLWIATLDGTQVSGNGIVACQWKGAKQTGANYDESLVYDSSIWLPVAPAPVPAPTPVPKPAPGPTQAEAEAALTTLTQFVEAA